MLLEVGLAGGGQLDGNKLVATKNRQRFHAYIKRIREEISTTHPRFSKREMMGPTRPRCRSS